MNGFRNIICCKNKIRGYSYNNLLKIVVSIDTAFFSSIRVDPGPTNRDPTSLLALKIRTPVANTGKLRSIGQMPVIYIAMAL